MKRVIALIGALASTGALGLSTSAHGAGFAFFEQDAIATGRGGAVQASAIGPSAGFYNIANVADLPSGLNVSLGGTYVLPFGSYESSLGVTDRTLRGIFPPNLHAYYGKQGQYGFGISVFNAFGLGIDWPKDFPGLYVADRIDLKTPTLQLGGAYRINKMITFGAGFSVSMASAELIRAVPLLPFKAGSSFIGADGTLGFGGHAGVTVTPMEGLRFAATYRSRMKYSFDGKAHFTFGNDIPAAFRAALPSDQPGNLEITTPDVVGAGVAWDISPNLTLELNWSHYFWSTYNELRLKFGPVPAGGNAVPGNCTPAGVTTQSHVCSPKSWMDVSQFRLGVDWKATPNLNLRMGYVFDMTPTPSKTLDATLPDATRHDWSLGIGYQWNKYFRTDFAYMLVYFTERQAPAVLVPQETAPGFYNGVAHLFALNFGLHF